MHSFGVLFWVDFGSFSPLFCLFRKGDAYELKNFLKKFFKVTHEMIPLCDMVGVLAER